MGQRMKRITVSLPEQMKTAIQDAVKRDGRSQGELVRAFIAQALETKIVRKS